MLQFRIINEPVFDFDIFGEIVVAGQNPLYEGEYIVTPKTDKQELETAEKLMNENLTVLAIPFHDVGNEYGGRTVIIG